MEANKLAYADEPANSPDALTRDQQRSRRKRKIRGRSITVRELITQRNQRRHLQMYDPPESQMPRTRGECRDGKRPCPCVGCKYHLYLDVNERTGTIKLNFPDLEVWEMPISCALDVADSGGATLENVGAIMNITRERVRQIEVKALAKLEKFAKRLRELVKGER
jgi:hypothetical protein